MATPGTIGPGDRLGATLALSATFFGVLILGVGFARDLAAPVTPTLDVILTETRTDEAPDEADFLAQAQNRGGGESDRPQRPREEQMASVPKPDPGIAPEAMVAQAPEPEPEPVPRLLTTIGDSDAVPPPADHRDTEPSPLAPGDELIEEDLEMARLAAEMERRSELMARRPKRKFVSASTREYAYAEYMRTWVAQVERVGTLNYPEEALRRGLGGRVVLTVAVRRDGSVEDIVITRPSGLGVLDQAAVRSVRLAEPFPPLPRTAENIDVLHIIRTFDWQNGRVDSE